MDSLSRGQRAKNGMNFHTLLIIKLPDSRVLRIMTRSLFLAMLLLMLPSLISMTRSSSSAALYRPDSPYSNLDFTKYMKILPILLRDLIDEGLIKKGHKGLIAGAGSVGGDIENDFAFLNEAGVHLITEAGVLIQNDEVFDFVFILGLHEINPIDRSLKNGGMAISSLSNTNPLNELHSVRNYGIVYLRRIFENTVVAMRKSLAEASSTNGLVVKDALKGLEDVYLEPPLAKPSSTSRKIKFLPNLLRDSLESYPRRVFISDDSNALDWFYKNYPMKDREFKFYDVEVGVENDGSSPVEMGVTGWLKKNVRREDYVVMKAEAQVVEEMIKDKTISLVDELFLECNNQWQNGEKEKGSKRAYWQCLELYGKVRDEGIAVHQWWN
ncbi:hypothetical protein ACJIZ3_019437 [Penstemon smallii]|uniref:DUF7870 domain-containing protein n=1 Tax=Penstemon smallii TaxID=265156 RepID=A0ABD3T250_9LAMI